MRRVVLTVAVLLCMAAPAQAQNLCTGQKVTKPPPTAAEREQADVENFARQRAEFGFRADLPYVRELIRRGVWEYDVGYIPVTPEENVYLKLRDELELGPKAERYLDRHKDVDGGVSVEDDWPHEPYLLLHLKRDVAQHLAAIKRIARYPKNLRAEKAAFSTRQLQRLGDRMWRERKQLEAIGFDLVSTGIGSERLHAELITKRLDAKQYFAKRYGSGVKVEVIATEPFVLGCVNAGSYTVAADGMSVDVSWETGGSEKPSHFEITEFPDRVEIGVVDELYAGPQTADLRIDTRTAKLSAPLGDRAVVDAFDREPLSQVGPRPGQPPCPPAPAEPSPLEQAIETRAEYGMNADPQYVRQRLSGRSLFTKAEARWLARVEALKYADGEISVNAKTFAGSVLEAKYPTAPHIVYRFKGDARKHLAELKRKSKRPDAVRVENVDFTLSELEKLAQTIGEGQREFDGFVVSGANPDEKTGTVLVRLITARTDHAAYFAARFGPRVRTDVLSDRLECYLMGRQF